MSFTAEEEDRMKASRRERHAPEPEEIKGTSAEQVGNCGRRPQKRVPAETEDPTSRYQKKTGQIKRDFGR